jgi:hypothetical protein
MITIGHYYRISTPQGERTIKALELIVEGVYGIYSPSDCVEPDDNQGSLIPEGSPEADQDEIDAWDNWYNS